MRQRVAFSTGAVASFSWEQKQEASTHARLGAADDALTDAWLAAADDALTAAWLAADDALTAAWMAMADDALTAAKMVVADVALTVEQLSIDRLPWQTLQTVPWSSVIVNLADRALTASHGEPAPIKQLL